MIKQNKKNYQTFEILCSFVFSSPNQRFFFNFIILRSLLDTVDYKCTFFIYRCVLLDHSTIFLFYPKTASWETKHFLFPLTVITSETSGAWFFIFYFNLVWFFLIMFFFVSFFIIVLFFFIFLYLFFCTHNFIIIKLFYIFYYGCICK